MLCSKNDKYNVDAVLNWLYWTEWINQKSYLLYYFPNSWKFNKLKKPTETAGNKCFEFFYIFIDTLFSVKFWKPTDLGSWVLWNIANAKASWLFEQNCCYKTPWYAIYRHFTLYLRYGFHFKTMWINYGVINFSFNIISIVKCKKNLNISSFQPIFIMFFQSICRSRARDACEG